jgi:hypothetical protein
MFTVSPGAGFSGVISAKMPIDGRAIALNGKKVMKVVLATIKLKDKNLNFII